MAKVGLENDTLKLPKCPSNWEYSTGQRQLLDIQSREQMDRLSFSAPKQAIKSLRQANQRVVRIFLLCPSAGLLRPPGELPFRDEQPGHVRLFEGEEPDLFRNAAGVSRQAAVAAHDPVAGDDNADRIVPYGTPMACADMVCFPCCRAISSAISL